MKKLTLTHEAEKLPAHIPENWGETSLAPYAMLAAAETVPQRCAAVAALCGVPEQALYDDVSLLGGLLAHFPAFLFEELPEASDPIPKFTHAGVTYVHVGDLDKINGGQLEALYNFNAANQGKPLDCGPALLAVLYCPKGKKQTADVVEQATVALASLPMSVAWPALAGFFLRGAQQSQTILTVSALSAQVSNLLTTLEQATEATASPTFFSRPLRYGIKTWIRSVRKTL